MKKLISVAVLVVGILLISIFNFKDTKEAFRYSEQDIVTDLKVVDKSNIYLKAELKIPVIKLKNKSVEEKINKQIEADIMNYYAGFAEQAESYLDEVGEDDKQFYLNTDFEIKSNRGDLYSIIIKYYTYSGGAHGDYKYSPYNINLATGQFIYLESLFAKDSNYKEVINQKIVEQIKKENKKNGLAEDSTQIYNFKGIHDNQGFYFEGKNLVVIFDLYEIAPYAHGIPKFYIGVDQIKNIIDRKYLDLILNME